MAERIKLFRDDVQNKIASAIRTQKRKYIPFEELDRYDKREIVNILHKRYGESFHIVDNQGYDVLKDAFFVNEFKEGSSLLSISIEHVEFDCFEKYYEYLNGNIYDKSCYYGYVFTDDEIDKYTIDLNEINFVSFCNKKIENFQEVINEDDKETQKIIKKNQSMIEFMNKYCSSMNFDFNNVIKKFIKKFCDGHDESTLLSCFFFPIAIKKYKDDFMFNLDLKIYCWYDGSGFGILDALVDYGVDFANDIIERFKGKNGYVKKVADKIKRMEKVVECYLSNTLSIGKKYYDKKTQQYVIESMCVDNDGICLAKRMSYYTSIQEFASQLGNNLIGCDLRDAQLKKEDIENYNIDDTTKLPIRFGYDKYIVEKKYTNDNFFEVVQKWFNNGRLVLGYKNKFKNFCDYVNFLNGDLSNADFIMCDYANGLKRVKNINIDGIKVRSDVAKELQLTYEPLQTFENITLNDEPKYEIESSKYYLEERDFEDDTKQQVSYITDIHMLHLIANNNCISKEDADYVIRKTVDNLIESSTRINLIGGDIASDKIVLSDFINELKVKGEHKKFFVTLGNHELWDFAGHNLDDIVNRYKNFYYSGYHNIFLVHNNLYYIEGRYGDVKEITEEELEKIDRNELREKVRRATLIIFGGLGFAGKNEEFNADSEIYRNTLDRDEEIIESEKFNSLYNKVADALYDKNVIILTHNPKTDWSGNNEVVDGFVYVNGHRHRNYFYDDGISRIYADNQVGYYQKNARFKKILLEVNFNYFSDYEDGIHEISRDDYEAFYRGIQQSIRITRDFKKLYMLKKDGNYMFIMEMKSGKLDILNGAAIKSANHSIDYYYNNLTNYSNSIKLFLSKYDEYQKILSNEIKKFGGNGKIHGCIIDVSSEIFPLNHIFINPLDAKITPYFAYSTTEKYVYKNLISLLKNKCPNLYLNYQKIIDENKNNNAIVPFYNSLEISNRSTFVADTEMYRISRIIKGLQYTTEYNIVRLWSDSIIGDPSEEKGKKIVKSILYPALIDEQKE